MAGGYIYLELSEYNVSIPNNNSVVTANVYYVGNGVSHNYNKCSGNIYINGSWAGSISHTFDYNGTQWIGSASLTVPHNTDGSKTVSASASFVTDVSLGTLNCNNSKKLTTIARATQPKLTPTSITLPASVTIDLPRASGGFTHTIRWKVGDHTETIAEDIATQKVWTAPISVANYITDAASGTLVIEVETYNNGTSIGKKTANLTVNIPASCVPVVNNLVVTELTSYKTKYGAFVQGYSKLKASFTETKSYSSPINSRTIAIGSQSANANPFTLEPVLEAGTLTVKASMTDKRSRTGTKSTTISVLAYAKPAVNMSALRSNSNGTPEPSGAYIACTFQASITSLNGKNVGVYKIKYQLESKNPDTDPWSEISVGASGNITFPATTSERYRVKFYAKDDLSDSESAILIIPTAYVGTSWAKNSAGKITAVHLGGTAKDGEGFVSEMKSKFIDDVTVQKGLTVKGIDFTITDAEYNELLTLLGG